MSETLTEGPEHPTKIENLLIVRLSAMGDVIHTLPAVAALRATFPEAKFGWVIEERWAELLCAPGAPRRGPRSTARPLVDWVHPVSLKEWGRTLFTLSTAQQIAKVWNDVRAARYDIAVDLQGAMRSALIGRWSGARVLYGAAEPRESPASLWYTRRAEGGGTHVIEQYVAVAEAAAQKRLAVPRAELPRDVDTEKRIGARLLEDGGGPVAILNPGAGWGAKRWPAERYGQVARALAADGLRPVLNCGPGEEELARQAEVAGAGAARVMKCSISELIALMRRAKLFVGGDTGPLHLAAALQVPVVAIFGPTDPARNGPYGTPSVVLRNPASPTTHARKAQPDEGMLEISVEAVAEAARGLLAGVAQQRPPHASLQYKSHTEAAHG